MSEPVMISFARIENCSAEVALCSMMEQCIQHFATWEQLTQQEQVRSVNWLNAKYGQPVDATVTKA